jgi:hypothetical protein
VSDSGSAARTGLIGTLVAGYALFDVIPIAVIVIALTAWIVRPLILFAITAIGLLVLNIACCNCSSATGRAGSPATGGGSRGSCRSVIGGERITERRVLIASAAYALPMAALFTLVGYELGPAVRAA